MTAIRGQSILRVVKIFNFSASFMIRTTLAVHVCLHLLKMSSKNCEYFSDEKPAAHLPKTNRVPSKANGLRILFANDNTVGTKTLKWKCCFHRVIHHGDTFCQ